jgi:hypothetical protein
MRRRLILPLVLIAFASQAIAAEEAKKPDEGGGNYVDISSVGLPTTRGGRLVNYVFAQVRLFLRPGANGTQLRTKEPYFRDALVRAANRAPFSLPNDANKLDEAALKRVMMTEAARIAGPGVVVGVQVMNQQPTRYVPKG